MTTPARSRYACKPRYALAAALACAIVASVPAAAVPPTAADREELGVLLYSPAERLDIERSRSGATPAADLPPTNLKFDGQVRRASAKGTVWLNSRPLPQGQAGPLKHAPLVTTTGISVDGKPLRVGETLDLTTGQRTDIVPQGAVGIKRAP